MTFLAQDLLYAAVLVLAVQWFRRDGLRAGLAAGLGAVLAVGGRWLPDRQADRPGGRTTLGCGGAFEVP
jgi:hypothetical protein